MPVEEPLEEGEVGEDADMGEAPPTEESALEQVLAPLATFLVAFGI